MVKQQVRVVEERGSLRLRYTVPGLGRQSLSLGLAASDPTSSHRAEAVRQVIEADLRRNIYDSSKRKYKLLFGGVAPLERADIIDPISLLEEYLDYKIKKGQIMQSTYRMKHACHVSFLKGVGSREPHDLINAVVDGKTPEVARIIANSLNSAYTWAIARGKTEVNPVLPLMAQIPEKKKEKIKADPFTRKERDLIIEAFSENKFYQFYTNFVSFGFYTGCRLGEIVALNRDENIRGRTLIVDRRASIESKGIRIIPGTKTVSSRRFPLNDQAYEIVKKAQAASYLFPQSDLLFPGPKGGLIQVNNFGARAWKNVLKSLSIRYRKPYCMRHTFITMCLEQKMSKDILAQRVGNTPKTIDDFYANFEHSEVITPLL